MVRVPAVAGQFYEGGKERLIEEVEECFLHKLGPGKLPELRKGDRKIKGAVVPHAGYVYSGPVAAHVYRALADDGFPETFVILGPNHTGHGSGVALTTHTFVTPLGDVPVDTELAKRIAQDVIDDDIAAHRYEHSIEVQLPFLQYIKKDIRFVPICMAIQDYRMAARVGEIIGKAIAGKDVVVLASTDLSHYEARKIAERKDMAVIDAILKLDPKLVYNSVNKYDVSMCGYGPVIAMLTAVKGDKATLLKYATSGDVSPMPDVVGYAAIVVTRG